MASYTKIATALILMNMVFNISIGMGTMIVLDAWGFDAQTGRPIEITEIPDFDTTGLTTEGTDVFQFSIRGQSSWFNVFGTLKQFLLPGSQIEMIFNLVFPSADFSFAIKWGINFFANFIWSTSMVFLFWNRRSD